MNAQELVKMAHEHGVELHANGDKLSVRWQAKCRDYLQWDEQQCLTPSCYWYKRNT